MRTLQTELKKLLGIAESTSPSPQRASRRVSKKRPKQPRDVKRWQSDYDWSGVEAELLESQEVAPR